MSPALAGGFFTAEPPGKPYIYIYIYTHMYVYIQMKKRERENIRI